MDMNGKETRAMLGEECVFRLGMGRFASEDEGQLRFAILIKLNM